MNSLFLCGKHFFAVVCVLLCVWNGAANANSGDLLQHLQAVNFDAKSGLNQNTIHSIYQTSKGFILCATPNGVYRYDGYEFDKITHLIEDSNSLAYSYVRRIDEDATGRMWALNSKALNCYNPHTGKFRRYDDEQISRFLFRTFEVDNLQPSNIWFTTIDNAGLISLNADTGDVERVVYPLFNPSQISESTLGKDFVVNWVKQTSSGDVWISSNSGLKRMRLNERGEVIEFKGLDKYHALDMQENAQGDILILNNVRLSYLRIGENDKLSLQTLVDLRDFGHKHNSAKRFCIAPNGDIWYVSWMNGLVKINEKTLKCEKYPIFNDGTIPEGSMLGSAIIDQSGVLWLGTWNSGLYNVNLEHKRFYNITTAPKGRGNLRLINNISGDEKGNIWFASISDGLVHLKIDSLKVLSYEDISSKIGIKSKRIFSLLHYRDYLWVNDGQGFLQIKTNDAGDIIWSKRVAQESKMQPINSQTCTFGDKNGTLWIGDFVTGKIYYIDTTEKGREQLREFIIEQEDEFDFQSIAALKVDSSDRLWIITHGLGVYCGKVEDMKLKSFSRIDFGDYLEEFDNNGGFSIFEDDNNHFWISSFGGGVVKISIDEQNKIKTFKHISTADGIGDNVVYATMQDKQGRMWFSTDAGLSVLENETCTFKNYSYADGVTNSNFRKWSSWQSNDGRMFFGGTNGLTFFYPDEIRANSYAPKIILTQLSVNDKPVNIEVDEEHIFSARENNFEFAFNAFQYDAPNEMVYYYMLEGIDKDWHSVNAQRRSVNYTNLSSGNYTFLVKAQTRDGIFSPKDVRLHFRIRPFWYETWWAILLYIIFISTILYWWNSVQKYRHKLKSDMEVERLQSENLLQLNKSKIEFYTNISHEIKTPLTIISGILDNLRISGQRVIEGRNFGVVSYNINRLLQLISQLLDFRRAVTGNMPLSLVRSDIAAYVNELAANFENYAHSKGVGFKADVPSSTLEADFDADKLNKILSNLLSNAFKFTPKEGEISVSMCEGVPHNVPSNYSSLLSPAASDYIYLSVCDTGQGISQENLENIFNRFFQASSDLSLTDTNSGVGIGLSYIKILVELHGGFIYATSSLGEGSTFYVVLPRFQGGENIKVQSSEELNKSLSIDLEFDPDVQQVQDTTVRVNLQHDKEFYDYEILIVDDNEEIRNFVREFLAPNYKIFEAENGRIGFDIALERIPDLIISDVMMPEVDGLQMVDMLRNEEKTSHIPIIMLTVNNHIDNKIDGLKAGADAYITKPFNVEYLKVRIEKLLAMRNTLKDKYISLSGGQKLSEIDINEKDKEFITKLEALIEENISNPDFGIAEIEPHMNYSKVQLYRKIKSIAGTTGIEFVRNYRLKRSVEMMHSTQLQIREILYDVGFTSPSYYSKCFKSRYGVTPTEFLEKVRK